MLDLPVGRSLDLVSALEEPPERFNRSADVVRVRDATDKVTGARHNHAMLTAAFLQCAMSARRQGTVLHETAARQNTKNGQCKPCRCRSQWGARAENEA